MSPRPKRSVQRPRKTSQQSAALTAVPVGVQNTYLGVSLMSANTAGSVDDPCTFTLHVYLCTVSASWASIWKIQLIWWFRLSVDEYGNPSTYNTWIFISGRIHPVNNIRSTVIDPMLFASKRLHRHLHNREKEQIQLYMWNFHDFHYFHYPSLVVFHRCIFPIANLHIRFLSTKILTKEDERGFFLCRK